MRKPILFESGAVVDNLRRNWLERGLQSLCQAVGRHSGNDKFTKTGERALKTLLIAAGAVVISASTAFAACTAPVGRYAGATAGVSYDAATKEPKSFQNRQFFVLYNKNGSGSVQVVLSPATGASVTANFPARGTGNVHTWNETTCSGKITATATVLGQPQTLTLAYVVVSKGNKILFSDANSGAQSDVYPYVITVEKQ